MSRGLPPRADQLRWLKLASPVPLDFTKDDVAALQASMLADARTQTGSAMFEDVRWVTSTAGESAIPGLDPFDTVLVLAVGFLALDDAPPGATETTEDVGAGVNNPGPSESKGKATMAEIRQIRYRLNVGLRDCDPVSFGPIVLNTDEPDNEKARTRLMDHIRAEWKIARVNGDMLVFEDPDSAMLINPDQLVAIEVTLEPPAAQQPAPEPEAQGPEDVAA